jgi:arginine deiminase
MAGSFALVADLEARWRPLTPAERVRAETLLGVASRRVRRKFGTIDARIASGALDPLDVVDVVCDVVKRVLMVGDREAVRQESETTGPFSKSQTYANPMGNLYFTPDDLAILGTGRRAFVVDLTPQP